MDAVWCVFFSLKKGLLFWDDGGAERYSAPHEDSSASSRGPLMEVAYRLVHVHLL
jgi:hypothetical protein